MSAEHFAVGFAIGAVSGFFAALLALSTPVPI